VLRPIVSSVAALENLKGAFMLKPGKPSQSSPSYSAKPLTRLILLFSITSAAALNAAHGLSLKEAQDQALKEFRTQKLPPQPFRVTQRTWTPEWEEKFGRFVNQVGRGVAKAPWQHLKVYMANPAINPYASSDPQGIIHYSDCADFPYFLRTYFAYKNGLPMSYVTEVAKSLAPVASAANKDVELARATTVTSPYGNVILSRGRANIPSRLEETPDFMAYWTNLLGTVSTATWRVGPLTANSALSDVYPVGVNREGIRPGTAVAANGHVLMVYDVDARGTVHAIDAHPDGLISEKIIKESTLDRARPDLGYGFYRFRPLMAVGGTVMNGQIIGAQVVPASNEEINAVYGGGGVSLEQWFGPKHLRNLTAGTTVDPRHYQKAFARVSFFDFLRVRLKEPGVELTADSVLGELMDSLCSELKGRVKEVNLALEPETAVNLIEHPNALPANIYSTEGLWEMYSTPSRDAHLRASVVSLMKNAVFRFQDRHSQLGIGFEGTARDYQLALLLKIKNLNSTCQVAYQNSSGQNITLTFAELIRRLPRMSFDPYHCAEKRWGEEESALGSCRDRDPDNRWYKAEAPLRLTIGKTDPDESLTVSSDSPITLDQLESGFFIDSPAGSRVRLGTNHSELVDLEAYFASEAFIRDLGE
jgi:hypothetical protein